MSSIRDLLRNLDRLHEEAKATPGTQDERLDEAFKHLKCVLLENGREAIVETVAVNVDSEPQPATEPTERQSAQPQGRDLATLISIGWKRLVDDLRQIPHDLFPNQTEEHS